MSFGQVVESDAQYWEVFAGELQKAREWDETVGRTLREQDRARRDRFHHLSQFFPYWECYFDNVLTFRIVEKKKREKREKRAERLSNEGLPTVVEVPPLERRNICSRRGGNYRVMRIEKEEELPWVGEYVWAGLL